MHKSKLQRCFFSWCLTVFLRCSIFLVVTLYAVCVSSQTCPQPKLDIDSPGAAWPQGANGSNTVVNVYLDGSSSGWTETVQNALGQAFTNWQNVKGETGTNCFVTFNYTNTSNSGNATNWLNVLRQAPGGTNRGLTDSFLIGGDGRFHHATISIDPGVTNPTALTITMAHEIGHTFGLGHCNPTSACFNNSTTVMSSYNSANGFNDTSWGRQDPSGCDQALIKLNYCPVPVGGDGGDPGSCGGDPCCVDPECCGDECCGDYCCSHPGDSSCDPPSGCTDYYVYCASPCGDNETCMPGYEDPETVECYAFESDFCCDWEVDCY